MSYEEYSVENRRRMGAALVVASAALLAAACGQSTSGGSAPTTTTEAVGQTAPAAPTTTKPYPNLTLENFPFTDQSGKIYEGENAFQKAHELRLENYTGDSSYSKLLIDLTAQMNAWLHSAANQQTDQAYSNYVSPSGEKGIKGIGEHFYDPAFEQTLSDSSDFNAFMTKHHRDFLYTDSMIMATGGSPYDSKFTLIEKDHARIDNDLQYNVVLQRTGNSGGQQRYQPEADLITLKVSPGADGRPVWKVAGITSSPQS